jgi:hypothetical protein
MGPVRKVEMATATKFVVGLVALAFFWALVWVFLSTIG